MTVVNCERCGKEVERKSGNQKRCPDCAKIVAREQNAAKERRRRARMGDEYRERERERYRENLGVQAQKKAGASRSYAKARADEERYQKLKERQRQAMAKYRDNTVYGGNRKAALERDDFRCTVCGSSDELHIHHIDNQGSTLSVGQQNNNLKNLVTLCKSCHMRLHRELEAVNDIS